MGLGAFLSGGGCSFFPSLVAGSPPSVSTVPLGRRECEDWGRRECGDGGRRGEREREGRWVRERNRLVLTET